MASELFLQTKTKYLQMNLRSNELSGCLNHNIGFLMLVIAEKFANVMTLVVVRGY